MSLICNAAAVAASICGFQWNSGSAGLSLEDKDAVLHAQGCL